MNHRTEIGFQVGIVANAIHRAIDQEIHRVQETPCTGMQGHIVGYLYRNRDREIYQRDVQEFLSVRRSTVTGLLQLMEKRGLIRRESVPSDARLKRLLLTPAGERTHEQVAQAIGRVESAVNASLTPEERETFLLLCEKLQAAVDAPDFLANDSGKE